MKTLTLNKKQHQIPSEWNELPSNVVFAFARNAYPYFDRIFEEAKDENGQQQVYIRDDKLFSQIKLSILYELMPLNWNQFTRLTDEQAAFLNQEFVHHLFLDLNLTKNPLPEIDTEKGKLYGPTENFSTIVALEFAFADFFYTSYHKLIQRSKNFHEQGDDLQASRLLSQANDILNKFMAVLYRYAKPDFNPEDPESDGDIRQPFNNNNIEYRIPFMSPMPTEKKVAVILYWEGCRSYLPKRFPKVFTNENEEEAKSSSGTGWTQILHAMAGSKFGTFDETCKTPIKTILQEAQLQAEERERMEKEMKKQKAQQ